MLTIYKASAGSGKTFNLAFEYILELISTKDPNAQPVEPDKEVRRLNHPKYNPWGPELLERHAHILAITFTNKATGEMKQRIIEELDKLANIPAGKDTKYAKPLMDRLSCTRADLAETCRNAMRQLLFDFGNFNVSTIDSFFQRVLRTFARELDRQGDYTVEIDDSFVMGAAIGDMLDYFNSVPEDKCKPLSDWLMQFITDQIENGGKTNVFNRNSGVHASLVKMLSSITDEDFKPFTAEMKAYLSDGRLAAFRRTLVERRDGIADDLKVRAEALLPAAEASGTVSHLLNAIKNIIAKKPLALVGPKRLKTVDNCVESGSCGAKFKGDELLRSQIQALFADALQCSAIQTYISRILSSLRELGLLAHAWRFLENFIAENNTLLLSDTNNMLRRIIDRSETPFIYERMGMRLHHFLIDEFQDTSRMQWENLRPLVANGVDDNFNSLIIGDEKQSIYRFRNSDSELLHTVVASQFDGRHFIKGKSGVENTNWRSANEIVRFNNAFFTRLAERTATAGFENVIQDVCPDNIDVHGYIRFIPSSCWPETDSEGNTIPGNLELMAKNILRQHADGYPWSSIVILAQSNRELTKSVEYLMANYPEIPLVSNEALFLSKSPAITLIINILQLIDKEQTAGKPLPGGDPAADNRAANASEVALVLSRYEFFLSCGLGHSDALQKALTPDDSLNVGLAAVRKSNPTSLTALVDAIVEVHLKELPAGNPQIAYIAALQDLILKFAQNFIPSVHNFLLWWERNKDRLCIPNGAEVDAVRLMTIHKSKGLQFDCVHIPYGAWSYKIGGKERKWCELPKVAGIDPHLFPPVLEMDIISEYSVEESPMHKIYCEEAEKVTQDRVNLAYVAYTRAVRELFVYYDAKALGKEIKEIIAEERPVSDDPRLIGIHGNSEGELTIGSPTKCASPTSSEPAADGEPTAATQPEPADPEKLRPFDFDPPYTVVYRPEAATITSIDSVLELDSDIDDDGDVVTNEKAEVRRDRDMSVDPAVQRGLRFHDILAHVTTIADLPVAIDFVAARMHLSEADVKDARRALSKILDTNDRNVARWFESPVRVLCEQPIYVSEGDFIKRPDRIVFLADGSVEVVDYKFTAEPSDDHLDQVRGYINLLRTMGYGRVRGYIWYPLQRPSKVVEVV